MAVLSEIELKYETLIEGIIGQGFGICDSFIPNDFALDLRQLLLSKFEDNKFSKAGIGQGNQQRQHLEIRNDSILWIEPDTENTLERKYIDIVQGFIQYMNRTCFTSLKTFEMHYACYEAGSFYRKHIDSFINDKSRQFSLIVYLNPDWSDEDAGQLKLYLENETLEVLPLLGRAICFPSHEIPHEVVTSNKTRLSLTGWLKK